MSDTLNTINKLDFILKQIEFILESNKDIKCGDDYATSFQGMLVFNSTIMCLQTIGETLKSIKQKSYPGLLDNYHSVPWASIISMRNIISHEYGMVDPDIIFDVVSNYLLPLKNTVMIIKSDL